MSYKVIIPDEIDINKVQSNFTDFKFTYDWDSEAHCVIYVDSIEKAIRRWSEGDKLKHFVPVKNDISKDLFEFHEIANAKEVFKISFMHETVNEVINMINKKIKSVSLEDQFSDLARYLQTIAVELVQNALIQQRKGSASKSVELIFKSNEKYFEIEVEDKLGLLDGSTILSKLKRVFEEKSYEDKKEGAGLGLFMILGASDKLIFEIQKNQHTKVKSIINKYKRLKEYKRKQSSLHIYEKSQENES